MMIEVDCVEDLSLMKRRKFEMGAYNMAVASALTLGAIVASQI